MPQNTNVSLTANTWTQITDANVTNITFQVFSNAPTLIKATNGATAPTDDNGSFQYASTQGERNVALSAMFPGVSGANRVWAKTSAGGAFVVVSNA